MGKVLQIRVSAVTWNEDLVEKLWPQLAELALTVNSKQQKNGVLELVQCLGDGLQFMDWPIKRKEKLEAGIEKAVQIMRQLESALANWDPREANKLSDELEDTLTDLEKNYI